MGVHGQHNVGRYERGQSMAMQRDPHGYIYMYSRLLVMSALDGDGAPRGRVGVRSPGFGTYGCWGEGWG